jgi:hypothetical protein
MNTQHLPLEAPLRDDPHARLEKAFIEEYLRGQGYSPEDLHHLPEDVVKRLMTEASLYASVKLTEVEARARFVHEVEGATSS